MYIPIFVQGVNGGTATNSGLILLPMTLGSVFSSQIGAFFTNKTSYRNVMIFSALIFILGTFLLSTLTPDTSNWLLTLYMIVAGVGVGFSFSVLGMASMHGFDARQRGSASSTMSFVRSLGMTVGLTVFGILQRNGMTSKLADAFGGSSGGAPGGDSLGSIRESLSSEKRAAIPKDTLDKIVHALSSSITQMFLWALLAAVLALVAVLFMGRERLELPAKGSKGKAKPEYGGGH
jgi:MFS family permease